MMIQKRNPGIFIILSRIKPSVMKKIILLSTVFFMFSLISRAQPAMSVYAELGGPGLASINFDTRFTNSEAGFGGRVGVGGFSIRDDFSDESSGVIFVPVGINYLLGKDQKNYFELGAGVTPVFGTGSVDGNFSGTFGHVILGYRLQPKDGGFTFRAFICPVFGNGFFIPYYAGLSFGYKFGGSAR
jgi:hypothetical protein